MNKYFTVILILFLAGCGREKFNYKLEIPKQVIIPHDSVVYHGQDAVGGVSSVELPSNSDIAIVSFYLDSDGPLYEGNFVTIKGDSFVLGTSVLVISGEQTGGIVENGKTIRLAPFQNAGNIKLPEEIEQRFKEFSDSDEKNKIKALYDVFAPLSTEVDSEVEASK